jgi:hypothetical protein
MRRAILGAVIAAGLSTAAVGFEPKDASYFCTGEISAGFAYDKTSKNWKGTTFKAEWKFVLRMKHVQSPGDFDVSITPAGSSDAMPCVSSLSLARAVQVNEYDLFRCTVLVEDYLFSLRTNRFLKFYAGEYVGEMPTVHTPDTPSVEGGTCTKIE